MPPLNRLLETLLYLVLLFCLLVPPVYFGKQFGHSDSETTAPAPGWHTAKPTITTTYSEEPILLGAMVSRETEKLTGVLVGANFIARSPIQVHRLLTNISWADQGTARPHSPDVFPPLYEGLLFQTAGDTTQQLCSTIRSAFGDMDQDGLPGILLVPMGRLYRSCEKVTTVLHRANALEASLEEASEQTMATFVKSGKQLSSILVQQARGGTPGHNPYTPRKDPTQSQPYHSRAGMQATASGRPGTAASGPSARHGPQMAMVPRSAPPTTKLLLPTSPAWGLWAVNLTHHAFFGHDDSDKYSALETLRHFTDAATALQTQIASVNAELRYLTDRAGLWLAGVSQHRTAPHECSSPWRTSLSWACRRLAGPVYRAREDARPVQSRTFEVLQSVETLRQHIDIASRHVKELLSRGSLVRDRWCRLQTRIQSMVQGSLRSVTEEAMSGTAPKWHRRVIVYSLQESMEETAWRIYGSMESLEQEWLASRHLAFQLITNETVAGWDEWVEHQHGAIRK